MECEIRPAFSSAALIVARGSSKITARPAAGLKINSAASI
jgi:hypothetical protein